MNLNHFDEIKLSKEISKFEEKSKKIFTKTPDTNICWRVWGTGKPTIFFISLIVLIFKIGENIYKTPSSIKN